MQTACKNAHARLRGNSIGQYIMLFIRQENRSSGCGPACVAMLASQRRGRRSAKPYNHAVEIIFGAAKSRGLHIYWPTLRRALRRLNIPQATSVIRCFDWGEIECLALVKCRVRNGGKDWHWVVFDGRKDRILYDPLKARPGPIPPRYSRPFSYLEVF